ncbi:hypothetical protein HZB96_03595 [Candidatus Gottesmanbacteria bacterium]|nr:hypothetical protein [Candidatus Gottesmanbacteria bacterium]
MTNQEIAKLLKQVAAAYILKGENRFKIIAYERAADTIEKSTVEAKDLWEDGKLGSLPGVGASIAGHLDELFRTGKVKHFEEIFKGLPQAVFPLLSVPGFGPKKAYKLVHELKLGSPGTVFDDLFKAAKGGKIASIEGFGERSQQEIIEALERFKKGQIKENRMPLPYAYAIAADVINYLKKNKATRKVESLGSLRRMVATIGDIDIAVSTEKPDELINWFLRYPKPHTIVEKGPSGATILLESGRQVDLRVQHPAKFGAMLQYFTGSKHHNIKLREFALKQGLSLSEYGIKPLTKIKNEKSKIYEYPTEEEFYKAIGLPWIPPELREDTGEIEAALRTASGKPGLPHLVELRNIKGDFHIHSDYNLEPSHDLGHSPLKEILANASGLGYEYIGISDHNPSITNHSSEQILSILKRRKAYFEQIMKSTKSVRVNLFIMLEVDIQPDGKLALPKEAFSFLDAVIVSVHSSFNMDRKKMTERILSGLSYPKAKILGHPSGRLLGKREGYEVDWTKLFKFCRENHKAIEINAYPDRLDLSDTLVHEAIREKVKLVIGTDSHEAVQMNQMQYGVSVARRGWAQRSDILNTLPYNKLKGWLLSYK